jgi:hypothetical protein
MLGKMKISVSAVIIFSTAFTASAATNHHRLTNANPATSNMSFDNNSDRCPLSGGPSCSTACLPSGPPCRTKPDGW